MIAEKTILEGFERLSAKWSLLRDEISLNVRGEFSENAFADESIKWIKLELTFLNALT